MLNDHRRACTGENCKVCRHLARQQAARDAKRGVAPPPGGPPAAGRSPDIGPSSGV